MYLQDYGTLSCWASNEVGTQQHPCLFQVVLAGKCPPGWEWNGKCSPLRRGQPLRFCRAETCRHTKLRSSWRKHTTSPKWRAFGYIFLLSFFTFGNHITPNVTLVILIKKATKKRLFWVPTNSLILAANYENLVFHFSNHKSTHLRDLSTINFIAEPL